MAINSLTGNFQPLKEVGGNALPQKDSVGPAEQKSNPANDVKVNLSELNQAIQSFGKNSDQLTEQPSAAQKAHQNEYEKFNQITQSVSRKLSFQVDDYSGKTVVKVIDKETDELIRQFPPDELLTLTKRLKELNEALSSTSGAGIIIKSEA